MRLNGCGAAAGLATSVLADAACVDHMGNQVLDGRQFRMSWCVVVTRVSSDPRRGSNHSVAEFMAPSISLRAILGSTPGVIVEPAIASLNRLRQIRP